MRILHCLWDDKFMDGTIRVYECDQRHVNEYVIVAQNPSAYNLASIKSQLVTIVTPKDFLAMSIKFDVIILHSFECLDKKYISSIPRQCKVVWYSWGFDLYGGIIPIIPLHLYYNKTKRFVNSHKSKCSFRDLIYAIKERLYLKKALSRVDYYSGVFPYEYDLINRRYHFFRARKLDFYYGDTDFFIKNTISHAIDHNKFNIIIGNSADPCNNHLDALEYLSKTTLPQESKIILPLSYAGSQTYINYVKEEAVSIFGERVRALTDYLPLSDYLELVSNCKVAIFFHERQQASDNIFMQMLYGAKVYMSETSMAYKYLKEEGFVVYSLQSDFKDIMKDLTDEAIMHNRNLLVQKYSESTIVSRVRIINDLISNNL